MRQKASHEKGCCQDRYENPLPRTKGSCLSPEGWGLNHEDLHNICASQRCTDQSGANGCSNMLNLDSNRLASCSGLLLEDKSHAHALVRSAQTLHPAEIDFAEAKPDAEPLAAAARTNITGRRAIFLQCLTCSVTTAPHLIHSLQANRRNSLGARLNWAQHSGDPQADLSQKAVMSAKALVWLYTAKVTQLQRTSKNEFQRLSGDVRNSFEHRLPRPPFKRTSQQHAVSGSSKQLAKHSHCFGPLWSHAQLKK